MLVPDASGLVTIQKRFCRCWSSIIGYFKRNENSENEV